MRIILIDTIIDAAEPDFQIFDVIKMGSVVRRLSKVPMLHQNICGISYCEELGAILFISQVVYITPPRRTIAVDHTVTSCGREFDSGGVN